MTLKFKWIVIVLWVVEGRWKVYGDSFQHREDAEKLARQIMQDTGALAQVVKVQVAKRLGGAS